MVPILYLTMWTPVRYLTHDRYEDALLAGLMTGYMIYEQWHYFTHFGQTSSKFLKTLKRDHMHHHYRQGDMGFGVSSYFWDTVFGTMLDLNISKKYKFD